MLSDDASRELRRMVWGGDGHETMSAALWRLRWNPRWGLVRLWTDWIAWSEHGEEWGHCRRAYEEHMMRVLDTTERARRSGAL
jgi:hypothetical protein